MLDNFFKKFFNLKFLKQWINDISQNFAAKIKKIFKYFIFILFISVIFSVSIFYLFFHDPDFYVENLPKKIEKDLIATDKWTKSCTNVPISRLKFVNVKFYDKKNSINRSGNLIILDAVADNISQIFKELYKKKLVIEKIKTINYYDDYEASYSDGNSISFICDQNLKSLYNVLNYHFGTGIDINPSFNPKIEFIFIPDKLNNKSDFFFMKSNLKYSKFLNRRLNDPRMNENFTEIFAKNGFTEWGGSFGIDDKIINFAYFGVNGIVTELLLFMEPNDAKKFFKIICKNYKIINKIDEKEFVLKFKNFYTKDPKKFFIFLKKHLSKLKKMNNAEFFNFLEKELG